MPPSRRTVRRTALGCLERAGALRAVGDSRWRQGRLLVLAYHGISRHDEHLWNGALYMAPEVLAERLRILRECDCAVIALAEAVERLYAGSLEPRSVVITFDDGYHDFVSRAYPLLADHGVPVTMYLPTVSLGWAAPSFPLVCSYLLWKANRQMLTLPEIGTEAVAVGDTASRTGTVATLLRTTKREAWSRADRDLFVRALAERVGVDYGAIIESRLFWSMSADDVTRLSAAGVDFQLHTHTHNTPRERVDFAREIALNRERIEALTGVRPTHFCYPSGNYDPRFLPWLREDEVVSAVTCDPGLASRRTPALMIPRFVDTSTTTGTEFRGWLTGASALLSRRKSYAKPPGD